MSRYPCLFLGVWAFVTVSLMAQQPTPSPGTSLAPYSRNIVPWRHFGPEPGDRPQPSNIAPLAEARPAASAAPDDSTQPATSANDPSSSTSALNPSTADQPAAPAPEISLASTVASLATDYGKREQERSAHRQELEAAAHNDPTLQALTEIQSTRLLLEGEQDRMQSSEQLAQSFTGLATRLQTHVYQVRTLLQTRKREAEQADAEIARVNSELPDLSLALRNLAMLPATRENDEFMKHLSDRLDHVEEILRNDRERSQQAHLQVNGLETDEQQLTEASRRARAKSVAFSQASQGAKLNQDLLANRLEFSVARKRAGDELANTSQALETSVTMRAAPTVQQAALGGVQPQTPDRISQQVETLRVCIRRTGDVTACRASGTEQP